MFCMVHLCTRNEITGVGECRNRFTRGVEFCVTACVIEVQVRVDYDRDLVSRTTGARFQCLAERACAVNAVHRNLLRGPLVADAGFDQNFLGPGIDEHAVHVHANPVLVIRRTDLRPELAWDHSKHRSAIEMEFGVWNDLNAIIPENHSCNPRLISASVSVSPKARARTQVARRLAARIPAASPASAVVQAPSPESCPPPLHANG